MWFDATNTPALNPQVVLNVQGNTYLESSVGIEFTPSSIWVHELIFPAYAALASVFILLLQLVYSAWRRRGSGEDDDVSQTTSTEQATLGARFQKYLDSVGGKEIFTFRLIRLLSAIALVALSAYTIFSRKYTQDNEDQTRLQFALLGVYVYLLVLSLLSVSVSPAFSRAVVRHLAIVSFVAWSVFAYRDLWPLATTTLTPLDIAEGSILWAKVGLLTLIGVVIPLFVPRQYIPFDPKDPATIVNPEQTASIISMALYTFLDPYIFLGYRIPHLSLDQLPALADYDYTKNLVKRSFVHIDPFLSGRKRHLFFGLMRVFWAEYIVLGIMLVLRTVSSLIVPIGMYRLLNYLSGESDDIVRPWVWIVWMGVGPLIGSVAIQWYIFVATRIMVQVQGLITQLVFEHALRIRIKAETGSSTSASAASSVATTPDNASIAERSDGAESPTTDDETQTAVSDAASTSKASKRKSAAPSEASTTTTAAEETKPSETKGGHLVGKLNNLVTTDLNNLVDGRDILFVLIYAPMQIVVCMVFLARTLGWSAFVGLAVIIVMFPIPGYIAKLIQTAQVEKMKKTDARVQSVTETMNVMRMIKLFGWEPRTNDQIAEKREEELVYQRKFKILELVNGNINFVIPVLTSIATYMTFTLIMKKQLTAALVFSSMAVFELLQENMHMIFGILPMMIQAKVSLDRTNEYLQTTELLDRYSDKEDGAAEAVVVAPPDVDPKVIGIREAAFTWSADNDGTLTPGKNQRNFVLRITEEVVFKHGAINLIVGPTGSGKTSILMALLGEMHYVPSGPNSYFQLPRAGGIAYAAQESWVQNETIRNNILFGAPYDEERYNKVIYQCGLLRDLELFKAGDKTEVGEKGLTLSGGQKARVTLARAVYSSAEILLLDDVLAALDVHTSKWIVEKCFQGDLIRGRTVLLVTHNVHIAKPVADYVVAIGTDGRIASQGSLSKALSSNKKLAKEVAQEAKVADKAEHTVDDTADAGVKDPEVAQSSEADKDADGKLILDEEISEGHVGWPALKLYFSSLSGGAPISFWTLVFGGLLMTRVVQTFSAWYLGYWARQYETRDPADVNPIFYLSVYSALTLLEITFYVVGFVIFVFGCLRASRILHRDLIKTVLGTTLRWLDKTPTSRIITRCTQDIQAVDGPISEYLGWLLDMSMSMIIKFIAVIYVAPLFMIPGVLISILGAWCGQIYIKAQLSVKREMSNARAPVLGHFGAAVAGLTSIRAYGAEEAFKLELHKRTDRYTRAGRSFYNLNRWVCIRIESLAGLFAAALAAYLVYGGGVSASDTGFSLTMAVSFSGMILWWVRIMNEFEVAGNSLERIQQYLEIEQEPKATEEGVPPAYWPASGELIVENLSAKYSENGPKVLNNISFKVNSGERVGIVGRTGSGKSSLTLALLRCILIEGKVIYDGLPTDKINLDALRENITIIPQSPELLSGTLRQNLDPFTQHDDAVLNDALRAAGLFSLQAEDDEGRITLDSQISSGGGNLSVGQRQILALARAIVRQSKLLILDEATSAIDYETDTIIQNSLRQQLGKDVTLLTVAHRLQTIMDADKIMVLDAGNIVEFDTPSELLKIPNGRLKALVDESGEKEHLYAMANGQTV